MTPDYILRPFRPSPVEYEAIVHVYNLANPHDPGSAANWQHWDQHRDPARSFTRYVVEHQSEIGGYGFSVRTDVEANIFRFAINFLPTWQTAELIHQFYSYLMGLCLDLDATALICQTREDESGKIKWLQKQGFSQALRYPRATLKVDEFDATAYSGLKDKIFAQGLKIMSLVELANHDPNWKRKVYDLEMLLNKEVPRPTGFTPPPFEKYAKAEFEDPSFAPELWLVALHDDNYVGTTSLFRSGGSLEILETGLTGIGRGYRRRGLATVLKCQGIEIAQELGATLIQTWNEENNPMFQLNLKLGFQAQPADVDWEKIVPSG